MEKGIKAALYPGTFDPLTMGHVSLIRRGCQVFDRIIVAVAESTPKNTLFSLAERVELARAVFAQDSAVRVEAFSGLTVEYARKAGVVAILRGLRAVSDFEYEFQLALMNRRLERKIQTVFLMTDYKWLYISSTMIKTAAREGANITGLVPENVREALHAKFGGHAACSES
ncbi:MAG: pantetheine-phosphate adenylyltransferase [Desulfovibrio sp.]|nr:pantetheine-phosphate adenylyltransferase [Desulfovibrio sp.]